MQQSHSRSRRPHSLQRSQEQNRLWEQRNQRWTLLLRSKRNQNHPRMQSRSQWRSTLQLQNKLSLQRKHPSLTHCLHQNQNQNQLQRLSRNHTLSQI